MKRNLLFLLALGVFLASMTITSTLMAQVPQGGNAASPVTSPAGQPAAAPAANPQPRPQIPLAVIDYVYLMEIHPQLYAETNKLLQRKKLANEAIQKDMDQLQKLQRELNGPTSGSPQYTAKMDEIRIFQANAQLRAVKENEEIELLALQFQYNAFVEIKGLVQRFAQTNNISVVINNMDITKRLPAERSPQTMDAEMSQMQGIVWIVPGLDITHYIEKMLNDTYIPKGYAAVDYNKIKEQMYGNKPGGGVAPPPTGVSQVPGQPGVR